ncbi:MAG: hypothetical protein KGJ02_05790 [Verrucomicrobiota bacterium]|nr:hypothetical protein [Verrucomicrobiota bacterium]
MKTCRKFKAERVLFPLLATFVGCLLSAPDAALAGQVIFNPSSQTSSFLSDPNALSINYTSNEVALTKYASPSCITPYGLGYQSGPDMDYFLGIDYQTNFIAVDLPYIPPINNTITGVNLPLQAPWGSYGWTSQNVTLQLHITKDIDGVPDFSKPLIPVQEVSMSPLLGDNGSGGWVGMGKTTTINFPFSAPVSVAAGQKIHFVLTAGSGWPSITESANGYALVWPCYDPISCTGTTFGPLSSMYATSSNAHILSSGTTGDTASMWSKSNHRASFTVLDTVPAYSTTAPFITYIFDAGQSVTWDFSTFSAIENPNGETGTVTYSAMISNADPGYYFNTSCVLYKNNVSQSQLKALASVPGRTFILQVHLSSPDGVKAASAGPASISYH